MYTAATHARRLRGAHNRVFATVKRRFLQIRQYIHWGKNLLCVCVLLLFLIHIDTSCESFALGAPFNEMCSDLTLCALWKRKKAALKVLTTDRAWGTRVEGLSVQFFSGTGVTTVVGFRVVTATSSFARDRAARDGHLTPAFP